MLVVAPPGDHKIVLPLDVHPLAVSVRLCPLVMVAGLLVVDVMLIVGAVMVEIIMAALLKLQVPSVT